MPEITTTLTQEQFDAVAAGLPDDPKAPKSDEERVEAYFQSQHSAISEQFVKVAREKEFTDVGLAPVLAHANLDADQKALLIADAESKLP